MAAPIAMVTSHRPTSAPSFGPPPLNGVHSPSAPRKCPSVHRAPGGRKGEAVSSFSSPLSTTQAPLQQPNAACLPPRERRAAQSYRRVYKGVAARLSLPALTRVPAPGYACAAACRPASFQPCPKHRAAPRVPRGMRCPSRPGTPRRGWSSHPRRRVGRELSRTATPACPRPVCRGRSGRPRPSTQGQRPAARLARRAAQREGTGAEREARGGG